MNKFKQKIRQSWKLLMQNRIYSGVSILTTAVTITYLMVVWMGYMLNHSNMAPEDKRERTTGISRIFEYPNKTEPKYGKFKIIPFNAEIIKQVLTPLKGAELIKISADTYEPVIFKLPSKKRITLRHSITDENIWKQFSYKFIEGRPFTKEEVESGLNVAVISRSTAQKIFHETENIVGREITPELPQTSFRVVGVVEDISVFFNGAFAQIWTPISNSHHNYRVDIIRKQGVSKKELEAELNENFVKYSQAHIAKKYEYRGVFGSSDILDRLGLLIISIILLIVPALNGMGLVEFNIAERISEIGIRKTYGASKRSIIQQLLSENMLSTGIGALIGLICSMLITVYFGELLLSDYNIGRELDSISFSTLFDIRIFGLALLFCFIINIMSVYIPAIRATRSSIADAVKGGEL